MVIFIKIRTTYLISWLPFPNKEQLKSSSFSIIVRSSVWHEWRISLADKKWSRPSSLGGYSLDSGNHHEEKAHVQDISHSSVFTRCIKDAIKANGFVRCSQKRYEASQISFNCKKVRNISRLEIIVRKYISRLVIIKFCTVCIKLDFKLFATRLKVTQQVPQTKKNSVSQPSENMLDYSNSHR